MTHARVLILSAAVATVLSGCMSHSVRKDINSAQSEARERIATLGATRGHQRVAEVPKLIVPVARVDAAQEAGAWLRRINMRIELSDPVPLSAVIRMFAADGVNIVTNVPQLDSYSYSGVISDTDAETALRIVLGSVGLDYEVDDARKLVTVRPMPSKTWVINVGNRQTAYASSGMQNASGGGRGGIGNSGSGLNSSGGASSFGSNSSGSGSNAGGMFGSNGSNGSNSTNGTSGFAAGGTNGGISSGTQLNGTGVVARDDFWSSLANELQSRLSILADNAGVQLQQPQIPAIPGVPFPQMPQPAMQQTNSDGKDNRRQIGTFALNPETGAITVQAPRWMLADLDQYLNQVQQMYNAEISFQGEVLMVTSHRTDSEGLDISSFGKFASGRYGAVLSNNALGGLTISFPNGGTIPNVAAGSQQVGGALLGAVSQADGLQVFNAWLSEMGSVSVMQRPVMTTTNSVPVEFRREFTRYYNTVSQEAASGGVGSAVQATNNELQRKDFGIAITINPRYDLSANLIRAQISLSHVLPAGEQLIQQTISVGDQFRSIPTRVPLETRASYSGEALLRDGDLIIIGGQTEDSSTLDESGLPGKRAPISGVFGTKKANRETKTYYFALRASVRPRGAQQ